MYDGFPIKIGISRNVGHRLHKMQTTLPYPVILLAQRPGDLGIEKLLHLEFRDLWLQGERFRRAPRLLGYIADLPRRSPTVHRQIGRNRT